MRSWTTYINPETGTIPVHCEADTDGHMTVRFGMMFTLPKLPASQARELARNITQAAAWAEDNNDEQLRFYVASCFAFEGDPLERGNYNVASMDRSQLIEEANCLNESAASAAFRIKATIDGSIGWSTFKEVTK